MPGILSLALYTNLAFAAFVSGTQVLLGNTPPSKDPECTLEEHDGLTVPFQICSKLAAPKHANSTVPASTNETTTVIPWVEPIPCKANIYGNVTYCVFSTHSYAQGRGISLVTTQEIASWFIQRMAPELTASVNDVSNPPFIQKPMPGKGVGLIAKHTIQRGQIIHAHTPVLIVHKVMDEGLQVNDRLELQRIGVERLPEASRRLYMGLMGHGEGQDVDKVEAVMITNSFQMILGDEEKEEDEPHNGVYPETARTNHDCRPNTAYYINKGTLIHYTHAVRPIMEGEEITLTYTNHMASHEERTAALDESWGFTCTCSLCSLPPSYISASDRRLQLITSLQDQLTTDWSVTHPLSPEAGETLVSLYIQERLESEISQAYMLAALAYAAVGEEYPAIKYAALAVEYGLLISGPEDEEVVAIKEFLEDPKLHWAWMRRLGRGKGADV
ncbi:hypothetical protein M422DRAFT_175701 [Sphaerobolus stellatus SS14]|uniref:Unplaced genomic scaffold SPHSTscaffold_80, whole genome shotgun sequence n=1 Tax=Sphaerobolus stellatus (strain SS14) TaxID=990650 RepID=A0A0C9U7T0_SPHS4|nr:hypothetical protein M422DRAFT_175701 [Sphaerobolus stellatus SS14]